MELDQRREPRVSLRVAARILSFDREPIALLTEDVSVGGLFVRTDTPPAVGEIVHVEVFVDRPEAATLTVRGAVAHVIVPVEGSDRAPGAGVRLTETPVSVMRAWEDFVQSSEDPLPRSSPAPGDRASDPVRRRYRRQHATLRATLGDGPDFMISHTADLSCGGIFVMTDGEYAVGTRLSVTLFDPETARSFTADYVVRRCVREPSLRGVGLELDAATEEQCAQLEDLVRRRSERGTPH